MQLPNDSKSITFTVEGAGALASCTAATSTTMEALSPGPGARSPKSRGWQGELLSKPHLFQLLVAPGGAWLWLHHSSLWPMVMAAFPPPLVRTASYWIRVHPNDLILTISTSRYLFPNKVPFTNTRSWLQRIFGEGRGRDTIQLNPEQLPNQQCTRGWKSASSREMIRMDSNLRLPCNAVGLKESGWCFHISMTLCVQSRC